MWTVLLVLVLWGVIGNQFAQWRAINRTERQARINAASIRIIGDRVVSRITVDSGEGSTFTASTHIPEE